MGRYRTVNVDLNRQYRNDLNQNFNDIERDIVNAESEIARVEAESKERDNLMAGTDVEAIIKRIDSSANGAELASVAANNAATSANTATKAANDAAIYANTKGDYANEKAIAADTAATNANLEASNLSQMKIDATTATQNANTATENANTATTNANNAATYATEQGDYAKAQGDAAKAIVDGTGLLKETDIGELVAGFNESGQVLDKNGNVVEGKVKSVNNVAPDGTGNISISIPTKTSELTNDAGFITSAPNTASQILIQDTSNLFTATNVESALSELFTNVSSGKNLIATAITGKGVSASGSDTFSLLANKINQISTGKKWAKGTVSSTTGTVEVRGLDFRPTHIILEFNKVQRKVYNSLEAIDKHTYTTGAYSYDNGVWTIYSDGFRVGFVSSNLNLIDWIAFG